MGREQPAMLRGVEESDFSAAVAAHQDALLAHCYRMTGSIQDAEDADPLGPVGPILEETVWVTRRPVVTRRAGILGPRSR
jgi:hypothetical protein